MLKVLDCKANYVKLVEARPELSAIKCSAKNLVFGNYMTYEDILRDYGGRVL